MKETTRDRELEKLRIMLRQTTEAWTAGMENDIFDDFEVRIDAWTGRELAEELHNLVDVMVEALRGKTRAG